MPARTDADKPFQDRMVDTLNPTGTGRFVLVCEHASNAVPPDLDGLGLSDDVLATHIAWDPGALAVAKALSDRLDAPLVFPTVSRLVYDCNRPPEAPSAVAESSEIYRVPGNCGLSAEARAARAERVYFPFHDAVAAAIDRRPAARPAILTVHSFTPVYNGVRRELDIGVLHDSDSRLADAFLAAAARDGRYVVRRNAPYGPQDGVTHTLRKHALPKGLLNVMIEIRNDLIADADGQHAMADWLARHATAALRDGGIGDE